MCRAVDSRSSSHGSWPPGTNSNRALAITEFVNPFETPGGSNHLVGIPPPAGRLIHAGPGRVGGSGGLRTKRSGWIA